MTALRDEAIVLSRLPLRERDLLVVLLTRQQGVQRGVARRARGGRGRLAALLEPLSACRVSLFRRRQAELATVDDAALLRSAFALARQPANWAAGQVVAELATLFCPEGQRSEASYRLVDHCLGYLLGGGDPRIAVAYAELWFLRLGGVLPDLTRCAACQQPLGGGPWGWEAASGHLLCSSHAAGAGELLPIPATAWLTRASRVAVDDVRQPPPGAAVTWLHRLEEEFTERPLRSWQFLQLALAAHPGAGAPAGAPTPGGEP